MESLSEYLNVQVSDNPSSQLVEIKEHAKNLASAWNDAIKNQEDNRLKFVESQRTIQRALKEIIHRAKPFKIPQYEHLVAAEAIFSDRKKYGQKKLAESTKLIITLIQKEMKAWKDHNPGDERSESIQFTQAKLALYELHEQLFGPPPSSKRLPQWVKPATPPGVTAECVFQAYVRASPLRVNFECLIDSGLQDHWVFDEPPEEFKDATDIYGWALKLNINDFHGLWGTWENKINSIATEVWTCLIQDTRGSDIATAIKVLIASMKEKEDGGNGAFSGLTMSSVLDVASKAKTLFDSSK